MNKIVKKQIKKLQPSATLEMTAKAAELKTQGKNVINLSDKCLEDVMIPRADVDAVPSDVKVNNLIRFINKTKHSRIPVYQENLDRIIGMIHIRDLFEKMNNKSGSSKNFKLSKTMVRKILFSYTFYMGGNFG